MKLYLGLAVMLCWLGLTLAQSTAPTTTPAPPSTTTQTVAHMCASQNATCDTCTKSAKCLWCPTNPVKCIEYPAGQIIPHKDVCDLGDARWGVCWVNYKVLLIVMGCLAGVLLLSTCCCIYCCCCRRKNRRASYQRDEARFQEERESRQARHAERRAERQGKVDDIRRKYGLSKEGETGYRRFENEA